MIGLLKVISIHKSLVLFLLINGEREGEIDIFVFRAEGKGVHKGRGSSHRGGGGVSSHAQINILLFDQIPQIF